MMAHYFKKQEEAKTLAEDGDDAYLSAAWADPRALKSSLLGTSSVAWRPAAALGSSSRAASSGGGGSAAGGAGAGASAGGARA